MDYKTYEFPLPCVTFLLYDLKTNKFAMARRTDKCYNEAGAWDIGAGKVEKGDLIEDTVLKEVKEEYGYSAEKHDLIFLGKREIINKNCFDHSKIFIPEDKKFEHWISFDYLVIVKKPELVKIGEPEKFDALEWFNFDHETTSKIISPEDNSKKFHYALSEYFLIYLMLIDKYVIELSKYEKRLRELKVLPDIPN